MTAGDALRELAEVVDTIDGNGVDVVRAVPEESDGNEVIATLRIRVPVENDGASGIEWAGADAAVDVSTPEGDADAPDEDAAAVGETDPSDGAIDDEAGVGCTHDGCTERFDSEHGMRIHRSKAHDETGSRRDPEVLEPVYEEHDSFAAMRDALDVDVSAQTVRRWMIEQGVHAPNAADASANADGQGERDGGSADDEPGNPTPVADPGLDGELPGSVTTEDLREAVEEATTLYEAQRRLDLDREVARELLDEFDLLELVHGRVVDQPRREELKRELDDRFAGAGGHAESSSD